MQKGCVWPFLPAEQGNIAVFSMFKYSIMIFNCVDTDPLERDRYKVPSCAWYSRLLLLGLAVQILLLHSFYIHLHI